MVLNRPGCYQLEPFQPRCYPLWWSRWTMQPDFQWVQLFLLRLMKLMWTSSKSKSMETILGRPMLVLGVARML
ncbi:unnamed protein product, partial [Brassica rapa subsp. narinosa]